MEWQLGLLLIFGTLLVLMSSGMPVALSFMLVNVVCMFIFWGGGVGIGQFILSLRSSITIYNLLPLPLFVLMGEVMFHSGIAPLIIDALDKWLGRVPGRLSLQTVAAGTLLASLTGADMASTAMLGKTLLPEMEKRGYKNPMSLGPILGSGCLAIMVPPSGLAVILGAVGEISIGKLLIAIIIPGLLMAFTYATYIIIRCKLQPSIAPPYEVLAVPLLEKIVASVRYVLPIGFVIFLVVGVILIGIATPTEAAATGALGTFILAAFYGKLNLGLVKKSFSGALEISVMIFMIICGAKAFSQVLAFSGISQGLIEFTLGLFTEPIPVLIAMLAVVIILGMFMEVTTIIMITMPLFVPIVHSIGLEPVWFGVIMLIGIAMGVTSPPFGLSLFVMKAVAPPSKTMGDIYRAGLPFLGCALISAVLIIAFPPIALWLPGIMR